MLQESPITLNFFSDVLNSDLFACKPKTMKSLPWSFGQALAEAVTAVSLCRIRVGWEFCGKQRPGEQFWLKSPNICTTSGLAKTVKLALEGRKLALHEGQRLLRASFHPMLFFRRGPSWVLKLSTKPPRLGSDMRSPKNLRPAP